MREEILKKRNEDNLEYRARLYRNKNIYGLNNKEIYELYLRETNDTLAESSVRCSATQYNTGLNAGIKKLLEPFDKSIMVINDIHLPFERDDVLEIVQKHANEITHLVIAGDLMDCESISSFPKIERTILVDELLYAYDFLKKIRKILNCNQKIIIFNGNHEERLKTTINKMQEKNLQTLLNPNILDMIVDGFTLYKDDKKVKYDGIKDVVYIPHWYIVFDKIVFCHPKSFSNVKGKMLENTVGHFINKEFDFDGVIFGHTHKTSLGILEKFENKFAVENPCLCKPQNYSDCGKLNYTPQTYGYTIIRYNNNEKITLNNIRVYSLEEATDTTSQHKINL